jgi:hypothetical protein
VLYVQLLCTVFVICGVYCIVNLLESSLIQSSLVTCSLSYSNDMKGVVTYPILSDTS